MFAGATTAFPRYGWVLGMLAFAVGAALIAAGIVVWQRAFTRSRAAKEAGPQRSADGTPPTPPTI